jgi:hypothetical protein
MSSKQKNNPMTRASDCAVVISYPEKQEIDFLIRLSRNHKNTIKLIDGSAHHYIITHEYGVCAN